MMALIFLMFFLVVLVLFIVAISRRDYMYDEDEVEVMTTTVTTTTTVNHNGIVVAGDLPRQREGNQFFVIDPADDVKMYVNSNDDMYEDAAGKIWKLV